MIVRIIDAFKALAAPPQEPAVQTADPEPVEPDSEMPADPELAPTVVPWSVDDYDEAQVLMFIRTWSGFESEMIADEQLIEFLGLDGYLGADLPDWMMTDLGVLATKGNVIVDEFVSTLQYVLENS